MFNPGNKAPALGGDRNVYGIFILYSKPSEHLHKAIWPMHKSPNLAPQANPQLYKVFCVLQILGCICLSRLERSNFRTEPPSATIFGMPYKKISVVTGGRGAQRGRSAPTAGAVLPSFAPVGGVGGKMVDHLGVCQLQRSREAVSPSVAENGIVGLAASVHLSVCLAEPVDEVVGGGGHCPVRFHCGGRKVGAGRASPTTLRERGSQVAVEVALLLVVGVVGDLTKRAA